jgi:circadian clock protein KaiC
LRVKGLDDRLGGGVPAGYVVLVVGPSGSLKSSLVYRVLHEGARAGATSLFLSMEQSRESLQRQMMSFGLDPDDAKTLHVIDVRALRRELEERDELPNWLIGLKRQLARYKEEVGCDLLAVDSLDALYALTPFKNPRNDIFQFFEELRDLGATTFLVSEQPRDRSAFSRYQVEEFLADGIVHLRIREMEVGTTTTVRRYLGIVKMRGIAHDLDYYPLLVEDGRFEIVVR